MKKVVLLAPTPPPASGIASWTVRMLKCGLGDAWDIVIVDEKVIGKRDVFVNNKRNLIEETKRSFTIWKNLVKALKDPETQVVQSCIPPTTFAIIREYICMLLTKLYRKKYIVHFRSTLTNFVKKGINTFVFEQISKAADMVFVLNGPSAQMVEKVVGKKYKLIPNFIEMDAIEQSHEINMEFKTALYVGGVTPQKGCDVIIEGAKEYPDITFRLVGAVSEAIKEMEVPSNVVLTGEKNSEEVKKEMENADVFLFLSRFKGEGFSNALVEAMAKGLPAIVTDWAANADMIIDAECGFVIDKCDPVLFVDAVNKIRDSKLRKTMSMNCIKRAREEYSEEQVIKQYVNAYEELLK